MAQEATEASDSGGLEPRLKVPRHEPQLQCSAIAYCCAVENIYSSLHSYAKGERQPVRPISTAVHGPHSSATPAQPRAAGSEGLPLSMVAFRNIPSWNVPKGTSGRPPLRPIRTAVDESQSWGFPHLCDPSTAVRLGRKCCRSACIPIGIFRVGLCARVAPFFTRTHSLAVLHWGKPQGCTACQSTGAACGSSALAVPHVLHPAQVAGM